MYGISVETGISIVMIPLFTGTAISSGFHELSSLFTLASLMVTSLRSSLRLK